LAAALARERGPARPLASPPGFAMESRDRAVRVFSLAQARCPHAHVASAEPAGAEAASAQYELQKASVPSTRHSQVACPQGCLSVAIAGAPSLAQAADHRAIVATGVEGRAHAFARHSSAATAQSARRDVNAASTLHRSLNRAM